jgi:hypothetical protein
MNLGVEDKCLVKAEIIVKFKLNLKNVSNGDYDKNFITRF